MKLLNTSNLKLIAKILLSIGVFIILFNKLSEVTKTQNVSFQLFQQLSTTNYWYLIIAVLLMPLNWGLESLKWHHAKKEFSNSLFLASIKEVLIGVSVSIFTPNRNGEFVGRVALLPSNCRVKGLEIYMISSISQQLFTILFGTLSLTVIGLPFQWLSLFILLIILLLILFSNYLFLIINKWLPADISFHSFKEIPASLWRLLIMLSGLRYLVFWVQYFLLFKGFDINISFLLLFMIIPSIFFIGSYIPSFALTEMGVKSAIAIYCLKNYSTQTEAIVYASVLLWIINVSIPALLGAISLLVNRHFSKIKA